MRFYLLSLLAISFLIPVSLSSQSIYEHAVDGQVYFRLSAEANPQLEHEEEGKINPKLLPQLSSILQDYTIRNVYKPFYLLSKAEKLQRTYMIEFADYQNVDRIIRDLKAQPGVDYAEMAPLYKSMLKPNDPMYNQSNQWHLFKINAEQAWDVTQGSKNIVVAVIDDAVDVNHKDYRNNMWVNPGEIPNNDVDDDGNGFADDVNGWDVSDKDNDPSPPFSSVKHGTFVAGIIGASTNDGIGLASIGYNVSIMAIKASSNSSPGSIANGYTGMQYAAAAGADVINMSWGNTFFFQAQEDLCDALDEMGIVMVSSAGNSGGQAKWYPAAYNKVIAVGSTGTTDRKSSFSQYGTWLDICAPGENIRSTVPGGSYFTGSGTSESAPIVSGVIALMLSLNPNLTPDQVKNCIYSTAVNINSQNPSYVGKIGAGRIDAAAAINCVASDLKQIDAGVVTVLEPEPVSCTSQFNIAPKVRFTNYGIQPLSSITVNYSIDQGAPQTVPWNGNLGSGEFADITLPTQNFSIGAHVISAWTSNPNGTNDQEANNDKLDYNFVLNSDKGVGLPYKEDVEAASFPAGWVSVNNDNQKGWLRDNTASYEGSASFKMENFGNLKGQIDELIMPAIDLTNVDNPLLTFQLSHAKLTSTSTDKLRVLFSVNCGQTWQQRYSKSGTSLSTAGVNPNNFKPSSQSQWRKETINLSLWEGKPSLLIKFEFASDAGNNLFIDNVNIDGTILDVEDPEPISLSIYPNPVNDQLNIQFQSDSRTNQIKITDLLGHVQYQQSLVRSQGNVLLDLSKYASGIYLVEVSNGSTKNISRIMKQ